MKTLLKHSLLFALLLSILNPNLYAQKILKGKVMDAETKIAISGASIQLKNTSVGSLTNDMGEFSLKIPKGKHFIVVNYIGYLQQEVSASQDSLEIFLQSENVSLDEVVITGAGVKKETLALGYSVSEVPISVSEDRSLAKPLEGKVLGVQKSGIGRKQKKLRIRGYVSHPENKANSQLAYENESYDTFKENNFISVESEALSTFSIDVDKASYANMRRFLNAGQLPPLDAVRVEELINYFEYSYPEPESEHPISLTTELSSCPWNSENRLVRIGLKGKSLNLETAPKSNLVFLLDVSGSMNSPNKLPLLKQSFSLLTDNLREEDRVAIVVYAGASGLVLPSTSGKKKEKILEALNRLEAGGSTAGAAGLRQAYEVASQNFIKNGNNRVILATDGDFNVGESSDEAMVKLIEQEREKGVFLSVLGFGTGNYKDSKMEKIADKGNGNYAYIDNLLEAKKVLVNEMSGTLYTIAKDVKLQLEFNPQYVQSYRLIGYENRMLQKEDFNDDTKDAGEMGAGHTVTALYELVPAGTTSESVASVDPLKYQSVQRTDLSKESGEVMTVKFRYKEPKGKVSKLMVHSVKNTPENLDETSDDFRFSIAVANFGMMLRKSKYAKDSSYESIINLAKYSKGKDEQGYRAEFIRLVELAELLSKKEIR